MQQINELIEKMVKAQAMAPRAYEEFRITSVWSSVNPPNIVANALPEKLVGGVLYLSVKNSAWAQQISLTKNDIAARLNQAIGEKIVTDIRFQTGHVADAATEAKKEKIEKVCPECGAGHYWEEQVCAICSREKKQAITNSVFRMVRKNPKISLSDIKKQVPGTTEDVVRRAKSELNARKREMEREKKFAKKSS